MPSMSAFLRFYPINRGVFTWTGWLPRSSFLCGVISLGNGIQVKNALVGPNSLFLRFSAISG